MATKLPDLPEIGAHVSFKTWRPYTPKKIALKTFAGLGLGAAGAYLSMNGGSIESLLASAAAGGLMFSLWLSSKRSVLHNAMLANIIGTTHTKFGIEFSSPLDSFSVMPEYFLSRQDIREWLWDVISNYKFNSYINKDGLLQHKLIWDIPSTDQQILIGTMLSVIDVALAKTAHLCMSSMDGHRNTQLDEHGSPNRYIIDLIELNTTTENNLLHEAFNQTLGFILDINNKDSHIVNVGKNFEASTPKNTELIIKGHGCWKIEGGHSLEVLKSSTSSGYDVTLIMSNELRGQTLYHKDVNSINTTWGHLVV